MIYIATELTAEEVLFITPVLESPELQSQSQQQQLTEGQPNRSEQSASSAGLLVTETSE